MKTLIVFYSNSSHTRQVAQILAAALSADLEEIHTVEPYGDELMTRSKAEIERGIYPEIRPLTHQPKDYDTIL
jgi:flavodoxin